MAESEVEGTLHAAVIGTRLLDSQTTMSSDSLRAPAPTLLLEDFEDGDNFGSLRELLGGSWWDVVTDRIARGTSTVTSPVDASYFNFIQAHDSTDPSRGTFLRFSYSLGDSIGNFPPYFPYAGLELNIGDHVASDFSGLDSLSFWAKGNGTLRFDMVQNGYETRVKIAIGATRTLTPEWKRYVIPVSTLNVRVDWFPTDTAEVPNFGNILNQYRLPAYTVGNPPNTWDDAGGKVNQLQILAISGTEFCIDDIRIHGVSPADLVP